MQTITLAFDPRRRTLSVEGSDVEGAGTVIDDAAVTLHVDPLGDDVLAMDLQFGVVICDGGRRYRPIGRLNPDGDYRIKRQILQACTGGQLPVSLRVTYRDRRVLGSSQVILPVAVVPDANADLVGAYGDVVMMRTDPWDWVPEWTYMAHSVVWWDDEVWISLADDNTGNPPSRDSEWWQILAEDGEQGPMGPRGPPGPQGLPAESTTPGEIVVRYIGDGIRTEWTVVHNLYTMTPFCQCIDLSGEVPRYVDTVKTIPDDRHVTLRFNTPPEPDSVQVLVSSGMGTAPPASATVPGEFVRRYVGNRRDTDFDVTHNLNCDTPFVQFLMTSGSSLPMHMDTGWRVLDSDTIRVHVDPAPDYNAVICLISSGMGTGADLSPYIWEPEGPSATWRIEHGLGRPVSFAVYDTQGRRVHCGELIESDTVTVESFAEEMAGYAIGW